MTTLANLPQFVRRSVCAEILRSAGFSEYAIREGLRLLPKHYFLGSKRAQYSVEEFAEAFKLPAPARSKSS